MGKFINEAYAFKGKVGDLHGSSINGNAYVKGGYSKRTKKAKGGEKRNHEKFTMAHSWLRPIILYVKSGFKGNAYKERSQGFNAAKSNLLLNAFEGIAPDIVINPALVKVSYGSLPLAHNMAVTQISVNQVKFTWENTLVGYMNYYDQAMVLAYDIKNKRASMIVTGQFRNMGESVLRVDYPTADHLLQKGGTFHFYLAFVAADRSRQSDSVYLGTITF